LNLALDNDNRRRVLTQPLEPFRHWSQLGLFNLRKAPANMLKRLSDG